MVCYCPPRREPRLEVEEPAPPGASLPSPVRPVLGAVDGLHGRTSLVWRRFYGRYAFEGEGEEVVFALQLCAQKRYLVLHELEGQGVRRRMVGRMVAVRAAVRVRTCAVQTDVHRPVPVLLFGEGAPVYAGPDGLGADPEDLGGLVDRVPSYVCRLFGVHTAHGRVRTGRREG